MSAIFKNIQYSDIGTSATTLYTCESPNESSIIIGMSLTNNLSKIVTIEVTLYDSSTTTSVTLVPSGSKISVGSSLLLCGELQKIVLEQDDYISVTCSDVDGLDAFLSIIDNDPTYSVAYWYGDIAVYGGGYSYVTTIHTSVISIDSDATAFGNLTTGRGHVASASDKTTGLFAGGYSNRISIDYVTINTASDAILFADLVAIKYGAGGCSDGTIGLFGSGYSYILTIDKVIIKEQVNATDFGDLTDGRGYLGSCGNHEIGVWMGGYSAKNIIDYVIFAINSNATDFGDLVRGTYYISATSNDTIGLSYGSANGYKEINKILFASKTNSIDFGDLWTDGYIYAPGACSNGTTALFAAGTGNWNDGRIGKVEFAIESDGSSYGNLTENKYGLGAVSGN